MTIDPPNIASYSTTSQDSEAKSSDIDKLRSLPPIDSRSAFDRQSIMTDNGTLHEEIPLPSIREPSSAADTTEPWTDSPKPMYDRDHRPDNLERLPPSFATTEALAHKINTAIDDELQDYSSTRNPSIQRASEYNDHGYPGSNPDVQGLYEVDEDGYHRKSIQRIKKPEMTLLQLIQDLKRRYDGVQSKSESRGGPKVSNTTITFDGREDSTAASETNQPGNLLSKVLASVNDGTSEDDHWIGYRYRNRMLGWKLTSYTHRKDLIHLLDLVHAKADDHTRSHLIHTSSGPRTQQMIAEIAKENYGDEGVLDFAADVFIDKVPKSRQSTGHRQMTEREIAAWATSIA